MRMPRFLAMGVKAARHGGPWSTRTTWIERSMINRSQAWGVSSEPTFRSWPKPGSPTPRVCLYTVAPEERFQVDFLPGRSDVLVASPCSGHGFKFSCLIGRVLADLATSGKTELTIDPWKI